MNEKQCTKCHVVRPIIDYWFVHPSKDNGKRRPDCKYCKRKDSKARYDKDPEYFKSRVVKYAGPARQRARAHMDAYLNIHPCIDCGESDPVVLEFDHVRGKKIKAVSVLVSRGCGIDRLKLEIAKCDVRCANCHRKKTAKDLKWRNKRGISLLARHSASTRDK